MMKWLFFSAILMALTGCGVSDGTEIQEETRSVSEVKELSCKVQWITTKDDFECAGRVGLDLENTEFMISHDSLEVRKCNIVPVEGKEALSCVEVLFSEPMITDFMVSVIEKGDTVNTELLGCVPLKDGGLVCLDTPLTAEITFDITIDPKFDGNQKRGEKSQQEGQQDS